MDRITRKLAMLGTAAVLASAVAAPVAHATGYTPPPTKKKKCNAVRGNGSEGCDPGRSSTSPTGNAGQNQGGDEGGPIRGGRGAA